MEGGIGQNGRKMELVKMGEQTVGKHSSWPSGMRVGIAVTTGIITKVNSHQCALLAAVRGH